jgi:hypothetical protein
MSDELNVVGAAMVPMSNGGYCSVTWPLAVLTVNETGIAIKFRSSFVKRVVRLFSFMFGSGLSSDASTDWWASNASRIAVAQIGRRSIIFKSADGDVRFAVLSHVQMKPIAAAVSQLGVLQENVNTTVPSIFGMSSKRK